MSLSAWRLWPLVLAEWRHHPWRHGMAVLAVALGVALAFSVHLINASALAEFSQAVRAVSGQPDLVVAGPREGMPDDLADRLALREEVAAASPVLELDTEARHAGTAPAPVASGVPAAAAGRLTLPVVGVDALRVAPLAPQLMPLPEGADARLAVLDPGLVFLNTAAMERLGVRPGEPIELRAGEGWRTLTVGGRIAAPGGALAMMDIAAAQALFGWEGRLTRVDLRLHPGVSARDLAQRLREEALLGPLVQVQQPEDAAQRVSNLSRAYRVNLTVLALVALFVGAFLVFSVVSLSVAQRTPSLALLGVLGLPAAQRRALVLWECAALGSAGAALGLAAGTGMAALALRVLAGDLGGGYFPGARATLQFSAVAAAVFGALGVGCALLGGWWPARQAEALSPAMALKGLGATTAAPAPWWPAVLLMAAGGGLALLPPIAELPLAAYASIAALLLGGVALVPAGVALMLPAPRTVPAPRWPLWRLARERARLQRSTATAAVAGVVTSLALGVAITVMVTSFREGVSQWLGEVLPADLYARSAASSSAAQQAWLDAAAVARVAALPGIAKLEASRTRPLQLSPSRPAVVLVARPLAEPERALPLVGPALDAAPGELGVWVSEAVQALYDAQPGATMTLPLAGEPRTVRVRGVWRDYARQFGAIAMDLADYQRLTGDLRTNDLALWLAEGTTAAQAQAQVRAALGDPALLEFAESGALRQLSLAIFDRSFAVTTYLQVVAIGIGLVGVAASLSAQVLARRKEFGLLAHLGLTRAQVAAMVVGECAVWLAVGVAFGLLLGLLVSLVLVHVVNPQSFHWRMDWVVPGTRLAALSAAVLVAGLLTSVLSVRRAASHQAVLAVKEDW